MRETIFNPESQRGEIWSKLGELSRPKNPADFAICRAFLEKIPFFKEYSFTREGLKVIHAAARVFHYSLLLHKEGGKDFDTRKQLERVAYSAFLRMTFTRLSLGSLPREVYEIGRRMTGMMGISEKELEIISEGLTGDPGKLWELAEEAVEGDVEFIDVDFLRKLGDFLVTNQGDLLRELEEIDLDDKRWKKREELLAGFGLCEKALEDRDEVKKQEIKSIINLPILQAALAVNRLDNEARQERICRLVNTTLNGRILAVTPSEIFPDHSDDHEGKRKRLSLIFWLKSGVTWFSQEQRTREVMEEITVENIQKIKQWAHISKGEP